MDIGRERYLPVMQLSVHINLPLCDEASQVWNGVGDICKQMPCAQCVGTGWALIHEGRVSSALIMGMMGWLVEREGGLWRAGVLEATVVRHGENGDLGDGATPALHTASSLIDGGQVCVHVSREAPASWHFFSGS